MLTSTANNDGWVEFECKSKKKVYTETDLNKKKEMRYKQEYQVKKKKVDGKRNKSTVGNEETKYKDRGENLSGE
jgi:hypothetical protein